MVSVSWIETISIDAEAPSNSAEAKPTVIEMLTLLDAQPIIKSLAKIPGPDILDTLDAIGGLITSVQLIGLRLISAVDRVLFHISQLIRIIDQFDDVLLAKLRATALRAKMLLQDVKAVATQQTAGPKGYKVPRDSTLSQIARFLQTPVGELMKLNPILASKPVIAAGTLLIYNP